MDRQRFHPSSLVPFSTRRLLAFRYPGTQPRINLSSFTTVSGTPRIENENDAAAKNGNGNDYSSENSKHIRSYDSHYIDGKWTNPSNRKNTKNADKSTGKSTINVIDSNNGRVVATVPRGTEDDTLLAIEAAKNALPGWSRQTTPQERLERVRAFLEHFRSGQRVDEIVDRLSVELGCTRSFARNVQAMAPVYHTQTLLDLLDNDDNSDADGNTNGSTNTDGDPAFEWEEAAGKCTIVKEPIGVVGAITPWNYPLNQIALKVIPALLAGCTVVLKPSEVTPLVAYSFAEAIDEAGLPNGVFNMVMGKGSECGEVLARHPDVDLVSFTGSTRAGKILSKVAAGSGMMKPLRTELGGKSAAVLLDDADFARVVPSFVRQLTSNSGQSCNALSRMLVPREFCETVLEIASNTMKKETVGLSSATNENENPRVTLGPLASEAQYNRVRSYIERGISEGATVITGGLDLPEGTETSGGFFVKPTLFGDVTNDMVIAQEEIFGPVLCVIPYDTEEEAIELANGTPYGLNNAVASSNFKRALDVASRLKSGMVMVNTVDVDFRAPFGGYKQSGNAREWGLAGLEEFLVTKTVNVPLEEYRAIVYGCENSSSSSSSSSNR